MSETKNETSTKKFTYEEAANLRNALMRLDLSYAPEGFNVREVRLFVQEEIIASGDILRAVEPQEKEVNEILANYNDEAIALNRKYSIGVKDVTLTKEERFEYEKACVELKEKHKEALEDFKEKNIGFIKLLQTECDYAPKKKVKKDMLPLNITAQDMAILSNLMEW